MKFKQYVSESSQTSDLKKELEKLISNIQNKSIVDKSMSDEPDGKLLAMFINPVLQSVLLNLKDKKSFKIKY